MTRREVGSQVGTHDAGRREEKGNGTTASWADRTAMAKKKKSQTQRKKKASRGGLCRERSLNQPEAATRHAASEVTRVNKPFRKSPTSVSEMCRPLPGEKSNRKTEWAGAEKARAKSGTLINRKHTYRAGT